MNDAIAEARLARDKKEWPIGAVVVYANKIIARAHNTVEVDQNPCAHAEISAINKARQYMLEYYQEKFLQDCIIFVTMEPCKMCLEYMRTARIGKLIYGTRAHKLDTYHIPTIDGIYEKECEDLLKTFGAQLRDK